MAGMASKHVSVFDTLNHTDMADLVALSNFSAAGLVGPTPFCRATTESQSMSKIISSVLEPYPIEN